MAEIHRLIGDIYDAGLDEKRWREVLPQIGRLFKSSGINLFVLDLVTNEIPTYVSWGLADEPPAENGHAAGRLDEKVRSGLAHHRLEAVYDHQHVDKPASEQDGTYEQVQNIGDFRYYMARKFQGDDRYLPILAIQRSPGQRPVTADEERDLKILSNHVGRAMEVNRRIAALESDAQSYPDALEQLASAAFLLNGQGTVIFMNAAARRLADQGGGLTVSHGQLRTARLEETAVLHDEIRHALATRARRGTTPGKRFSVSQNDDQRLVVLVTPLRSGVAALFRDPAAVMVLARDPSQVSIAPNDLMTLFGLTSAEAMLAASLVDGGSLADYSKTTGCAPATARWHLKNIFTKTGTHSQTRLVSLILRTIAVGQ